MLKTLRARSVNLSNLSRSFTCLSPPFQWQRVEPGPLCRSGKPRTLSYNTRNLASRNTTIASRLSNCAHPYNSLPRNNRPPHCFTLVYRQQGGQTIICSGALYPKIRDECFFFSCLRLFFVRFFLCSSRGENKPSLLFSRL